MSRWSWIVWNTVGAWESEGITDQTTNNRQINAASACLLMASVEFMDALPATVIDRFQQKLPRSPMANKVRKQALAVSCRFADLMHFHGDM